MKKHLKCLALFFGVVAGYVAFLAIAGAIIMLIAWLIGSTGLTILAILTLLACFVYITHSICSKWD